jgi:hypothetical protein
MSRDHQNTFWEATNLLTNLISHPRTIAGMAWPSIEQRSAIRYGAEK